MFRANRGRIIGIVLTVFVIYFLFSSRTVDSEFRRRTEAALSKKHGVLRGDLSDEALTQQTNDKLQGILEKQNLIPVQQQPTEAAAAVAAAAKTAATKVSDAAATLAADVVEDDVSVAGRKTMTKPKDEAAAAAGVNRPKYPKAGDEQKALSNSDEKPAAKAGGGDPGKDIAREKLQEYLKKPMVIFSKSYCPHSKRAKQLLLDLYTITPTPLVVELDQLTEPLPLPKHTSSDDEDTTPPAPTLGQKLQALLGEITGRRTVPNVMLGTVSIGGNDNIWEMHNAGTLADKIRELGGKRITNVVRNEEAKD